ncbi:cupin domain-containing protein [Mesorhizobium sp. PL10]
MNLAKLAPGGESSLLHRHSKQDEFIFILEGEPTLVRDSGEFLLGPGMCAGFPGIAHRLVNRTLNDVVCLEVGDRTPGDEGTYPNDDLKAALDADGKWQYTHKDGQPY